MCQAIVAMTGADVRYCPEEGEPYCARHQGHDNERVVAEAREREGR